MSPVRDTEEEVEVGANEETSEEVSRGMSRAEYLEERDTLIEGERNASESFDKAMLTLSGGVFALSITFVKEIAPQPIGTGWLLSAWIGFAISLLATLISFLSSQEAWRMQRTILGRLYRNREYTEWSICVYITH